MSQEDAFQYLDSGPFCLVALDRATGHAVKVNETFEQHFGALYKFKCCAFSATATEGDHRIKLEDAIELVRTGEIGRVAVRNVEMLTLAGEAGLPIKRHFDWTFGKGTDGDTLLFGYPCTEQDVEKRAKDDDLVDFFQNAPIALHWLSGDGIILWANQTELDALGYTAEEYIGQPIMKFCPDEEELVLEIFKQLGSGKSIQDVPVRFRAKDGRIVDLLIDSNVKYDDSGNFAHTRCFIRDDTKRKIREARASLLLEETKRSLKILDNFMSRSIHHLRTPLHLMQTTCELIADTLRTSNFPPTNRGAIDDCLKLISDAHNNIDSAVSLADDISALVRLDQGNELEIKREAIVLAQFGKQMLALVPEASPGVRMSLKLDGGGASVIFSDRSVLEKILCHLLRNATTATKEGSVELSIGYMNGLCTITVIDTGSGITDSELRSNDSAAKLPPIFQRYHRELLPEDTKDFEEASSVRGKIENTIKSAEKNGLGIGLSLSYYLVQSLGGELRYSSKPGLTKFWFSLPKSVEQPEELGSGLFVRGTQSGVCNERKSQPTAQNENKSQPTAQVEMQLNEARKVDIAQSGLRATDRPSVLVVEDTALCAKLLCKILSKFDCATTCAENGQVAIDILRKAPAGMYSVILMDLRMPVVDGITATRIIKEELKMTTPIIALTAETGIGIKAECVGAGFDEFFNKPVNRLELKKAISKYTANSVRHL
mmetsp:Transcript_3814/g.6360  ORF Transcript_3814/g.6360 Transcript_3814/m.6360 type:complete len:715 (+) Transcript_3814:122-2266(+)|eukprot:CAMPEP_0119014676 /NCGR_PEP_ID=MMETSP1176-20130426/10178_1 /TAXON_ID=265551 /ORGANISM="Synedropsis recta cf, Strain CCMP1620" /LENGTH=714 /DNA_ID=CAMNT_0006967895 /DNA_START=113 /DNA_END=2260 /DNA_ORIENTATION=+